MDKSVIRERLWDRLEAEGVARFPFPPHGRIPNFAGADDAAANLAAEPEWQAAETIKANPDAPQLPARRRALREGKTVYMAVPRLRDVNCFLELDPAAIDDTDAAATVSSMDQYGRRVQPADLRPVDLVLCGSVAVTETGARIGKGEGYSDLEYAILREQGLLDVDTPVATTVHDVQIVDDTIPVEAYDVPMDLIVTPTRVLRPAAPAEKPTGIDWDQLSTDRIAEIPVLESLQP